MGIVNVESRTFERMLARFEEFARRMDALCHAHRIGEPEPWLDNQQVCQLLNISKRTLQTLRGNGSLSYTQINHKIYYRAEDVQSFLAVLETRRRHKERRRNGVKRRDPDRGTSGGSSLISHQTDGKWTMN